MKILAYVTAPMGSSREKFRDSFREDFLAELLRRTPEITRCNANMVSSSLSGGLPGEKMGAEQEVPEPAYDGVIEIWLDATANRTGAVIDSILASPAKVDAYWAQEFISKDTAEAEQPPVLRLISPCFPTEGMGLPQVYRYWQEHVEKANRIHVGVSRYIRNWHMAPLSSGAPASFGAPMLSFQTMSDWQERFYKDDAGRLEIAEDVCTFVSRFSPLLTKEYRLK